MSYKCVEFGDKTFATKEAMFDCLLKHQDDLIKIKKAAVHKSHEKGQIAKFDFSKLTGSEKAPFEMKEGMFYPIINTTNYMDSHSDVHFPGLWTKSLKEQQGKIFYVLDHKLEIEKVITWPEDVTAFVQSIPWGFAGKEFNGYTEALIFGIEKKSMVNDKAKEMVSEKRPVQNSIRMRYVKMRLGVDDKRPDFAEQKAYYDSRINEVVNKDVVELQGYFWGIEEAGIEKEGSMVLFGSNDATPIKYMEAEQFTSGTLDPLQEQSPIKSFYSHFI